MGAQDTDRVREYARREFIEPARRRGETRVRIVAGDVHRALRLYNRVPLVCSALASREFLRANHLRIEKREGPPSMMSTTVAITYVVEDLAGEQTAAPTLYQLRGIAKKAFQELGGGEAFLQSEREPFNAAASEREGE
jgi:hypothetical protein